MAFHRVAALEELWIGEMMTVRLDGRRILVLRTDHAVCAYEDRCGHLGVPLSNGQMEGFTLTCLAHHYQYDARTGQGINPRRTCLQRFAVRIEDGQILVDPALSSREERA
jgi:toluene monooxygenase system ferredoxin subunit